MREALVGVEQVEQRRVGRAKLALQRIRRRFQKMRDALRVLVQAGRGDDEADAVAATSPGAPGHLLQLGGGELRQPLSRARVDICDDDRARRKVYAGRDRRGRKDRVEQSCAHQALDDKFPRGDVPGVMRGDAAANDRVPVTMIAHFRVLFDETAQDGAPLVSTLRAFIASGERGFRRCLSQRLRVGRKTIAGSRS